MADYRYELKEEPYFQLSDEELTFHPFQSWPKLKAGMRDIFSYSANQEDHHLVVYEKENDMVWMDVGGMARYKMKESADRLSYMYHYNLSVLLGDNYTIYSDADLISIYSFFFCR